MRQAVDVVISEGQLFALGSQIEGPRSRISPLAVTNKAQELAARERVVSPELVSTAGGLRPELTPAFETLARARSFAALGYLGRSLVHETAIYYPDNGQPNGGVALANTGDGIRLLMPAPLEGSLEMIRQFLGESLLDKVELDLELPLLDAWLFFALIDLARRAALEQMLERRAPAYEITPAAVHAALESQQPGLQWLAPYFDECLSLSRPSMEEVAKALFSLAERGLLRESEQVFQPTEVVERISAEFLVVDAHLRTRAALVTRSGEVLSTDVRAIQGRSGAILAWSQDQEGIELVGLSTSELLVMMSTLLHDPAASLGGEADLLPRRGPKPPPEVL